NIPRYVDTFEEEEPIDIIALSQEMQELDQQIKQTDSEFLKMVDELTVTDENKAEIDAIKKIFGE
ncbi:MAG: type I restriction-modification system subunit M, partial [Streptococcaceae bacterium]|nr:type I restriction-modification system subunit M [Streptococcaceae bacterium]